MSDDATMNEGVLNRIACAYQDQPTPVVLINASALFYAGRPLTVLLSLLSFYLPLYPSIGLFVFLRDKHRFNFDHFGATLAKHGISPKVRLTRTEWSTVRQLIRGRPRRFSKAFVAKELKELNAYRGIVRKMQHHKMARPAGMKLDVCVPIKVGTTVTAHNTRFNVLHRGMILAYDLKRHMYLIQFEKKELGFDFCKDTEVASHGIPDLLDTATEMTLDGTNIGGFSDLNDEPGGMVYGTGYQIHMSESVFCHCTSFHVRFVVWLIRWRMDIHILCGTRLRGCMGCADRVSVYYGYLYWTVPLTMPRRCVLFCLPCLFLPFSCR